MREIDQDEIIIPVRRGQAVLAGASLLVIAVLTAAPSRAMLDADWLAGSSRMAWANDLSPALRASIMLAFGLLELLLAIYYFQLAHSGTIAIFTGKSARVRSLTGWHEIDWADIFRIDIRKRRHRQTTVILRRGDPSWTEHIWFSSDPSIALWKAAVPEDELLAELSRRRPDLLAPETHQALEPELASHRAPKELTNRVELDSKSWTG